MRVEASFKDFDGDVEKWKNAFYEIWRYQMGYSFAYEITLIDRKSGVWLSLLARKSFKKNIVETMQELGYRNIQTEEESVGIIQLWDISDPVAEHISTVVAD